MYRFFENIRQKLTEWCIKDLFESVEIGALHQSLFPYSCEIYEDGTDNIKFIEQTSPCDMYIQTPSGMSKIKHTHKTVQYDVWELKTTNHTLKCADKHIVIDQYDRERFVDSLQLGELIQTEDGLESVVSVMKLDIPSENMYDIELDDGVHLYYTDGIVSHNSITSAIYLLWYAMFHFEKTILIASNKNAGAMEMIHRIRFAYEELPYWLKAGITEDGWNKHQVGFDNGSRIISTATSEDSGRGLSISKLFLDEFAFVPPAVQSAFFTSIMPTLATGGSCIMTSTPNGDNDMFAQIWRSAIAGSTVGMEDEEGKDGGKSEGREFNRIGFAPLEVRWDQPPGRDEKFKQKQIGLIGLLRWQQEYECLSKHAIIQLIDENGNEFQCTIEELVEMLSNNVEGCQ